jgi:hypothetical protein
MVEAIADSGHVGHEDDINFLELDFDDAAGTVVPNDNTSAGVAQDDGAGADDFDFQINEYEVVDDAGDHTGNGEPLSGGFTQAELGVPQSNTAESEIGYEDEEPLRDETAGHESEITGQAQGKADDVGSTDNVDEIDYDDGDLETVQESSAATETQAAIDPLVREEGVTTQVFFHRVLDDTVAHAESTQDRTAADSGSIHEPSKPSQAGQQGSKNNSVSHTGEYLEVSTTGATASEVSDVMVLYNGVKYELCASVHNEDPETYFFAGSDNLDAPLWQFFGRLRDVIKDEIEPSDDLVIEVPQLKLEFGEVCHDNAIIFPGHCIDLLQGPSNEFLDKHTFRDILNLYRRFKYNDGLEDAELPQLVLQLVTKPNCQERFAMLTEAADAGRGWSEFLGNPDGSDISSGHHSEGSFDGDQDETGSGEEHTGDDGDDDMQHEAVEIVEEAYFYDDTNDADDHDAGHLFDDQDGEDHGHHANDMEDPNEGFELAGELAENNELDRVPDHFDESMADDNDDGTHQTYTDQDGNAPVSHANAGDEDMSNATGTVPRDIGMSGGGGDLESFNEEPDSALEASNTLSSGNNPFRFRPPSDSVSPTQQEWLDDFMERDPKHTTPEMWKTFDALPHRPTSPRTTGADGGDEDLIDYSDDEDFSEQPAIQHSRRFSPPPHFPRRYGKSILDVPTLSDLKPRSEDDADDEVDDEPGDGLIDYEKHDLRVHSGDTERDIIPSVEKDDTDVFNDGEGGITVASLAWLKQVEVVSPPSASLTEDSPSSLKPSSVTRRPVCKYRGVGITKHLEAGLRARSSISPGQAALMMEPRRAAESGYSFFSDYSPRSRSGFAFGSGSHLSQQTGANLSDHQVQQQPALQSAAALETAHVSVPHNDSEHGDDTFAANDDAIDMEGFAAYDEAGNSEPLVADAHSQVTDPHDTSATSTLDGDEITYEDETVALASTENGTHEAGGDVEENVDEIDWENDGAEDVAAAEELAEEPTNPSSPSGLSIKRGREDDDLISLDDEAGMSTLLGRKRRATVLMQSTDAKRRKI